MDAGWSRERFACARVARLATGDGAGRPHLVPIVFVLLGDGLYSAIDTKPKSNPGPVARLRRLDNIRANPAVSVLVDHYDDDWSQLGGRARTGSPGFSTGPTGKRPNRSPRWPIAIRSISRHHRRGR